MHCCFSPAFFLPFHAFSPRCRAFLDNDDFWSKHDLPLQEAVILSQWKFLVGKAALLTPGRSVFDPTCATLKRVIGPRPRVGWLGCAFFSHQNRKNPPQQVWNNSHEKETGFCTHLNVGHANPLWLHMVPLNLGRTCAVYWSFRQRCHGCARGLLSGGGSKGLKQVLPLLFQLFRKSSHSSDDLHKIYIDDQWCVYIYT